MTFSTVHKAHRACRLILRFPFLPSINRVQFSKNPFGKKRDRDAGAFADTGL